MKTRYIALALAATMGLGSVSAFAQDHHRDGRGAGAWQHQRAEQGRRDWAYDNHYARSYGYRHDNNGDVVGALVLGALTGALVGQAANTYNAPAYYNPPPSAYYNPAPTNYYNPVTGSYNPPAPVYYNPGYGYYGN